MELEDQNGAGATQPGRAGGGDLDRVWDALRQVDDPEVGMNIVELGLVYGVDLEPDRLTVSLTMTSAACPMGEDIVEEARYVLARAFPGIADIDIDLVWDPPWTPERMSPEARDFFGWEGE